jgi:hypothetical protein
LEPDLKLHIHFEPGSRYGYSGEGIELAQFVVETATGRPLQSLMDEYLFQPDGMTRTSMVWEPRFESDFANGYDQYGRSLGPERRPHADAAGSVQTTLRDYATFLSALLRGRPFGIPTTGRIFNHQIAIHSAHQFPSLAEETTTANDPIRLSYGLGWGIYSSPYGKAFFKEGHDEGWRHLALCFREHGDGILILTNSSNGEGIFKPLIDQLLGPTGFPFDWDGYTSWDKLPPLPKLKEHTRAQLTPAQLERLTGRYALKEGIVLTVTVEDGHLFIRENDEEKQEYLPESSQDFYSATSSDECTFQPAEGPAQVRCPRSVESAPALTVAAYALLLLATQRAFKDSRQGLLPRPKWMPPSPSTRISTQQAIHQLRAEVWGRGLGLEDFSPFASSLPPAAKPEKLPFPLASAVGYANA